MEKITLTLLQDYNSRKKGSKCVADEAGAEKLIADGIAEKYVPAVTLDDAGDIAKEVSKSLSEKIVNDVDFTKIVMGKDQVDKALEMWDTGGEFFLHVKEHGYNNTTEKMKDYKEKAITGQGGVVDSDGGFLIPEEFSTLILNTMNEQAVIAPRTRRIPVNKMIKLPFVRDDDKSSSWFGGVTAGWSGEGQTIGASTLEFRQVRLELNKLAILIYATDELMDDSAVALESFLSQAAGTVLAKEFDDAIIVGTGAGRPLGLLNSPSIISVAKETGQAPTTFNMKNALAMWQRVSDPNNAVWLMNRDVMPQVWQFSQIVGTGGAPVMVPNAREKLPEILFGAPIIQSPHCKTLGTTGDIYLTDLSQYLTATKAGGPTIKSATSIHVAFVTDQIAFRFTMRVDGRSWWNAATTPKNGSNTVSPIVKLDARA